DIRVEPVGHLCAVRAAGGYRAGRNSFGRRIHIARMPLPSRHRSDIQGIRSNDERIGELTLADADAAGESSAVVEDTVIGDFQIVRPAVHEDAAPALGAVLHAQAIDARGVAEEITDVVAAI